MGFFNEELIKALFTGDYFCPKCKGRMIFENEVTRDILVCPLCGNSMDLDEYGSTKESYEELFPTKEEVLGYDEEKDNDDNG